MIWKVVIFPIFLLLSSSEPTLSSIVTVITRQGSTVTLPCTVDSSTSEINAYVIEWLRHGQKLPVFIKIGKNPSKLDESYQAWEDLYRSLLAGHYEKSERMEIASLSPPTGSLKLKNVSISDSGKYQCRVSYLREKFVRTEEETWVELQVKAPPTFVLTPPPTIQGSEGRSLLLRCIASGVPAPDVTWIKDGWTLQDGETDGMEIGNGEINIISLSRQHAGRYTCMAKSLEGQVQYSTVVYVSGPPFFLITPQDTTTRENQDVLFGCKAKAYPDDITYRWYHNGIPLANVPNLQGRTKVLEDGTMVIYYVTMADKGRVTCEASNGHGTPPKANAELIVEYRARVVDMPKFVYAGVNLATTLTCPSMAEPPVTQVIWKKDGRDIAVHQDPKFSTNINGSLVIRKVAPGDVGSYTCVPYNIHGTLGESQATQIILRDPPKFILKPDSNYLTAVGSNFEAPCTGEGDPSPTVTWTKMVGDSNDLSYCVVGGSLTIASIRKHHHGVWRCTLSNAVGQTSADITITVQNTTPQPVKNFTVTQVSDSSIHVTWVPGYDGGFPQHYKLWYKQSAKGDHIWKKRFIDGYRTVAAVSKLKPNTFYQLSLVPGNQEGSGPFSNTVTVKTKDVPRLYTPTKPIQLQPPDGLASSTLSDGRLALSWKPLRRTRGLLGYLLEYRRLREVREENPAAPSSAADRRRRDADIPQWTTLQTTPPNVTTYALEPDEIYRDQIYEFQILAVTSAHYSTPSKPVQVSTKGLAIYPCLTKVPAPSYATLGQPNIIGIICGVLLFILLVLMLIVLGKRFHRRSLAKSYETNEQDSISSNRFQVSDETTSFHENAHASRSISRSGEFPSRVSRHGDELYPPRDDVYVTLPVLDKYAEPKQFEVEKERLLFRSPEDLPEEVEDGLREKITNDTSVKLRRETAAKVLSAQREEWMKRIQLLKKMETPSDPIYVTQPRYEQHSPNVHKNFCRPISDRNVPPRRVLFEDRRHPMTSQESDESVFGVVKMTSRDRCRTLPNRSTPPNNAAFDDVIRGCDVSGRVEEWTNQNVPLLSSSPMKPFMRHRSSAASPWQPRSRASYSFDYAREPPLRDCRAVNATQLEDSTLEIDCSNSDIEVRFIRGLSSQSPDSVKIGPNQMDTNNKPRSPVKAPFTSFNNSNSNVANSGRLSIEALISPTHQQKQHKKRLLDLKSQRISLLKPSPVKDPDCFSATVLENTIADSGENVNHVINTTSDDLYCKPTMISIGDIAWENVRKFGNSGSITSPNLSSQCSPNKLPITSPIEQKSFNNSLGRDQQKSGQNRLPKNLSLPLIPAPTMLNNSVFPPIKTAPRRMRSLPTSPIKMVRSPTAILGTKRSSLQNVSRPTQQEIDPVPTSPGSRICSPTTLRNSHIESQSSGYGTQDTTQLSPGLRGMHERQRKDNSSVEENYEWDSTFAMESEILDALKNFETHSTATPISEKLRDELQKFTNNDQQTYIQQTSTSSMDQPRHNLSTSQNLTRNRPSSVDVLEQTENEKDDIEKRCSALRQEFLCFRQLQGFSDKNP